MKAARLSIACAAVLSALWLLPAGADASFGFLPGPEGFNVRATDEGGQGFATLGGSHPYSLVTEAHFNKSGQFSDGDLRNLEIDLPPGLIENPGAVPACPSGAFGTPRSSPFEESLSGESCSAESQVGTITLETSRGGGEVRTFGVFNLAPPPGFPSQLGFAPFEIPVTVTPHVRETTGEYGLSLSLENLSQLIDITGFRLTIWGTPWTVAHNSERGNCLNEVEPEYGHGKCSVATLDPLHDTQAYLTLPTSCGGPLSFQVTATAWQQPAQVHATSTTGGDLQDCDSLPFNPVPSGRLSTGRTSSPTGFDFTLDGNSGQLVDPTERASSQVRRAVVTLAEGMTINPSVASGLSTCSESQYAAETLTSAPGAGCPNVAKIGELTIESPLVEGRIEGSMFFAAPYDNRFGTLLALYLVAKDPERGILVKVAGRIDSNPETGQLTTTFDDLPQLPYSHFNVHFREGQRSPLATPSTCGGYVTAVDSTPWRDPNVVIHQISDFNLDSGVGGGPCPQGPVEPFNPKGVGGTLNSNASSYAPFYLHLTRADAEQEITSYSATLPPGLLGKIAGVPFCSEAEIAAAKHQSGAESAENPACSAASKIGRTYTGYGLGSTLAYAPGSLYLAGPYHGSPISIVAIDSAKVGPFDLGTVVIRSAIRIDRQTAQVSIDSAGSDPIPHILSGFPLRLRDIRIYIDRPKFTINPTSCEPFSVVSTLTGAGARFSDPADDQAASATSGYQATNCSALGFAPKFGIVLKGGHERGDYPSLRATVTPRGGDSNISKATVVLPPKIFIAQEHIGTICTTKQFAARACPAASIYGTATAETPLVEGPMTGPVYLRTTSGEGVLPDLVATISGRGVEIDIEGRIDSYRGGLRAKFFTLPDAPVTKFTMALNGGKHGIIANATDTCRFPQKATAQFIGHDNGVESLKLPLQVNCKKGKHGKGNQGKGKAGK